MKFKTTGGNCQHSDPICNECSSTIGDILKESLKSLTNVKFEQPKDEFSTKCVKIGQDAQDNFLSVHAAAWKQPKASFTLTTPEGETEVKDCVLLSRSEYQRMQEEIHEIKLSCREAAGYIQSYINRKNNGKGDEQGILCDTVELLVRAGNQ